MPKRKDIKKILIIGSGPIAIGQACEFDYSGSQACKVLAQEGYTVILVNSNPATIMTDPEMADKTYIEPITVDVLTKIIARERPDVLLPTLGGQTALNTAVGLENSGVLRKYKVETIGANIKAIKKAEDRMLFKETMLKIGLDLPRSDKARNLSQACAVAAKIGFPVIIRPSFTLGGTGGSAAYNIEEFRELAKIGLESSMICEILIEESVIGWKEFELEVMRDLKDNVVIICSIENFDPMGVHTGDSITVAPAQTLTDREYQKMRDAAIACIRAIGVETGGSNIQFAIHPDTGRMVIIEMNPRVSRSSALASKATGFPIAKIAAKLAVGYTLDEIPNDITRQTPACFEPAIDYCVVKIPRFTFEKFPAADPTLTISMKSVGEAMSIGRTFKEALQKGLRSLEIKKFGLETISPNGAVAADFIHQKLRTPNAERIFYIGDAIRAGMDIDKIYELTKIDRWFLRNIKEIIELEKDTAAHKDDLKADLLSRVKEFGFSDVQIAKMTSRTEDEIRRLRKSLDLKPDFKLVDTCAAEFQAHTPYYYSTYDGVLSSGRPAPERDTLQPDQSLIMAGRPDARKVIILGGGPNRIGQGIEFDYCCCHASYALKEEGVESIMINCNPETVSTDYDTSDRLYFEPLTVEDVLNIVDLEKPIGLIVQFGGQTPLNISVPLEKAGVRILGTSPDSIDIAEDRKRFQQMLKKLKLIQPDNGTATSVEEARGAAGKIGYPVVVRPSYVLGGRAMEIVYDEQGLNDYMAKAQEASPEHPILIDKFLEDAIEVDVDAIADGKRCVIGGILEHIEEAGIHSGDSAMVLPPHTLGKDTIEIIKKNTYAMAKELDVKGLMNVQYAVKNNIVYVLEVNPRASRTVPFVSKAIGVPLAKLATKIMLGKTLDELGFTRQKDIGFVAVKESVFPFNRFPGVDAILGPEMKSTGEVMGIDLTFGLAYAKSQIAAGQRLPTKGTVFISVKNQDKRNIVFIAKKLADLKFKIMATSGTADALKNNDIEVEVLPKIYESRPNILDLMKDAKVDLIINTPSGKTSKADDAMMRALAISYRIPLITTVSGAQATVNGVENLIKRPNATVKSLQEYHKLVK